WGELNLWPQSTGKMPVGPTGRMPVLLPPLFSNHQLQSRPNFIYGAYLDIDNSHRQRDVANGVFGDVGLNSRRFLRPRNPDHSIRNDFGPKGFQLGFQRGRRSREKMDELDIWFRTSKPLDVEVGRQAKQRTVILRSAVNA